MRTGRTGKPIYRQICEHLQQRIESGELRRGELIPSENELTRQFGVSRMTVRAALAELEKSGVIRCTRGKGREVCASRRAGSTLPVAVFPFLSASYVDDVNYHNGILNGMSDALLRHGLSARYVSPDELENRAADFLEFFAPERYSGLIWINSNHRWVFETLGLLPLLKIPHVLLNSVSSPGAGCYAATDHFGAMARLAAYLLACGHRRIALVSADIRVFGYARLRWEGFLKAMREAGVPREQYELFICREWVGEEARRAVSAALDWGPRALVIGGGGLAGPVFAELEKRRLSVPGDLSLAMFDRLARQPETYPEICCVSQELETLGLSAVELLVETMQGGAPGNILVPAVFHPGKTVACRTAPDEPILS